MAQSKYVEFSHEKNADSIGYELTHGFLNG
jgi:hypothetical protein